MERQDMQPRRYQEQAVGFTASLWIQLNVKRRFEDFFFYKIKVAVTPPLPPPNLSGAWHCFLFVGTAVRNFR